MKCISSIVGTYLYQQNWHSQQSRLTIVNSSVLYWYKVARREALDFSQHIEMIYTQSECTKTPRHDCYMFFTGNKISHVPYEYITNINIFKK